MTLYPSNRRVGELKYSYSSFLISSLVASLYGGYKYISCLYAREFQYGFNWHAAFLRLSLSCQAKCIDLISINAAVILHVLGNMII